MHKSSLELESAIIPLMCKINVILLTMLGKSSMYFVKYIAEGSTKGRKFEMQGFLSQCHSLLWCDIVL